MYGGEQKYEIESSDGRKWVVDLIEQSCSCRQWDMTGIPCAHGSCAIMKNRQNPEDYVNFYYTKVAYQLTYNHVISPVPSSEYWSCVIGYSEIKPPLFRRQPGRPKKLRRRGADEPRNPYKITRRNLTTTCSKCGMLGHNKRGCQGAPTATTQRLGGVGTTRGRGRGRGRGRARGRGKESESGKETCKLSSSHGNFKAPRQEDGKGKMPVKRGGNTGKPTQQTPIRKSPRKHASSQA